MTKTFTDAAKTGYWAVGSGIKSYIYGIWLQLSRVVILFAWFFIAGLVLGILSPAGDAIAVLGSGITFFAVPVLYGYWKQRNSNAKD